jgi:hypothetical protein
MAAWIGFIATDPDDIPAPALGKLRIFVDADTGVPSYKDDTGTVHPLGTTGPQGAQGDPGAPGADSASYFPGGWT